MSGHTPGPWKAGYWGGVCNNPEHVKKLRHPGPPECVYDHVFYPMDGSSFVGIASEVPGVDVVGTHYDELKITPQDARLIAAAPTLLETLKACAELLDDYSDVNDGEDGPRPNRAMSMLQEVEAAIAKAEGRS